MFRQILLKSKSVYSQNAIFKQMFHRSTALLGTGVNYVQDTLLTPARNEVTKFHRKVTIYGASGHVGKILAHTLFTEHVCEKIIMCDIDKAKSAVCGETLDMLYGGALQPHPDVIQTTKLEDTAYSDVIVITFGPTLMGKSRLDQAANTIGILKKIVPTLAKKSPECIFLVVSNPVDIATYATWRYSGFESNRVIGSGTDIDSAWFRYHIATRLNIASCAVDGWVIGEHGDSGVPLWSSVSVAGTRLSDIDPEFGCPGNEWEACAREMKRDGFLIVKLKGYANFAISRSLTNMINALLQDHRTIHCCSTLASGLHGIKEDVFLSLPVVLGNRGVRDVVVQQMLDNEHCQLKKSAKVLLDCMKKQKF